MIRGLLLDFYGTVVEEDDEVVAAGVRAVWVNRRGRAVPEGMGAGEVVGDLAGLLGRW